MPIAYVITDRRCRVRVLPVKAAGSRKAMLAVDALLRDGPTVRAAGEARTANQQASLDPGPRSQFAGWAKEPGRNGRPWWSLKK